MRYSTFQKVVSINRGPGITMLIYLGMMVLELIGILIGALVTGDSTEATVFFVAIPIVGIIMNVWVVIMCSLGAYTVGYTNAIGAGMTRKVYLRGAYLMHLAYAGAALVLSLLGALISFLGSLSQVGEAAEKMRRNAWMVAVFSVLMVVVLLLFVALGMLMANILLRYGAKMLAFPILVTSGLFMLLPKVIEWYEALPQDQILNANLLLSAGGVVLVAAFTLIGRQVLYKQHI